MLSMQGVLCNLQHPVAPAADLHGDLAAWLYSTCVVRVALAVPAAQSVDQWSRCKVYLGVVAPWPGFGYYA